MNYYPAFAMRNGRPRQLPKYIVRLISTILLFQVWFKLIIPLISFFIAFSFALPKERTANLITHHNIKVTTSYLAIIPQL